ncbi:MAG: oxidoreductase [Gammaproteobacteria bacterium]|nr:oxidoreductase [Gammaproteobacteria bacterium]
MLNKLITLIVIGSIYSTQVFAQQNLSALDVEQPEGWNDELALTIPEDLNPDPDILEIELEARVADIEVMEGLTTPVWTYGGSLPGPLLRAKVGDTVIVHFRNSLPEPTTIHWHGLRVPNDMDGVPGVTQPPIPPGGEFRYEFVLPDSGTYWYHPHVNSAAQVGWGMYGPIVVEDPSDPEVFGDELVMVISDMSLNDLGEFLPPDNGGDFGDLFGREGTTVLVNGKIMPTLKVRKGKQQRWRIINASRSRYTPIGLRGHMMTRIGGDNGLAGRSESAARFVLTPAERGDFVFTPANDPGTTALMRLGSVNRGFGTERRPEDLMYIETVDLPEVTPEEIPTELRTIEPIDISNAIEKELEMTIALGENGTNSVEMGFNGIPYWNMQALVARVGETHVWTLSNNSGFNHPFHLHGYFFQVLDDERVPEWKDTVDVPDGETLRIAINFEGRPGMWMYHCHILDHARVGMMGQLWVGPEGFTGPVPDLSIPMGMD